MKKITCVLFSILAITFDAHSYEVSPMYLDLEDTGRQSSGNYTVGNVEQKTIAVEVSAFKVGYKDGEEVLTPAEDEFLILPPQAQIPSAAIQNFRVKFIPKSPLSTTAVYRIVFSQLDLDADKEGDGSTVNMLIDISTIAFVSPSDGKPVPKVSLADNKIQVENKGNRILDMYGLAFDIKTESGNKTLFWRDLNEDSGSWLMPGSKAQFKVPTNVNKATQITLAQ
ncbi:molecular chaperone [Vibrio owensii]|uniref:molecular chaperone n=1 Tax=Vibrio owensii TaxID=696485 RepID=UPI0033994AAC